MSILCHQIGHKFLINVIQKKQKYRHELMPNTKFPQYRVFLQRDLVKKKLKAVENHQKDL